MGLKFERTDNLDKMFEEFAIDPDKKEKEEKAKREVVERFLEPENKKEEEKK